MFDIGFTGTQRGMTVAQSRAVRRLLRQHRHSTGMQLFIHGGCIGADADAHFMAHREGYRIVLRPGPNERYQAQLDPEPTFTMPVEPNLVRNRAIVNQCGWLIAAPAQDHELRRSGTWATIRHARRVERRRQLVYPDGTVVTE